MISALQSDAFKIALAVGGGVAALWHSAQLRDAASDKAASAPGIRSTRFINAVLAFLVILAVGNYYRFDLRRPLAHIHSYDTYFYYLGSKYFPELGFERLYPATIVADQEDDGHFTRIGVTQYRRQPDQTLVATSEALAQGDTIRAAFTDKRWDEFVADVRHFKREVPAESWRTILSDFGYNATPLSMLAQRAVSTRLAPSQLKLAGFVDLALLVIALVIVWRCYSGTAALFAALLLFVSYSGRWPDYGSSMLRLDWLAACILAVCLLRAGRPFIGGAALGYAIAMRVFPAFLLFGAIAQVIIFAVRRRRPPASTLSFAGGAAGFVLLSSAVVVAFSGTDLFRASLSKLNRYEGQQSLMPGHVGAGVTIAAPPFAETNGIASRQAFMSDHSFRRIAVGLAGLALTAVALRRREDDEACAAGQFAFYFSAISLYYYHILRVLLVITSAPRAARAAGAFGLAGMFAIEAATYSLRFLGATRLTIGTALSLMFGGYAVALTAIWVLDARIVKWRQRKEIAPSVEATFQSRDRLAIAALVGLIGIFAGYFGVRFALYGAAKTSAFENTVAVSQSNLVQKLIAGVPEAGRLKEARNVFQPDEPVMIHAAVAPAEKDYVLVFEWTGPDDNAVYRKAMKVAADWQNVWINYRGPQPMAAGAWRVRVSCNGTDAGEIRYEVRRERSAIPTLRQVDEFESNKLPESAADAIGLGIRGVLRGQTTTAALSASIPESFRRHQTQIAIRLFVEGRLIANAIGEHGHLEDSLATAIGMISVAPDRASDAAIELSLIHEGIEIPAQPSQIWFRLKDNVGFSLVTNPNVVASMLPSAMYRQNLSDADAILRQLCVEAGQAENCWKDSTARLIRFRTQEFVLLPDANHCHETVCGRAIANAPITREALRASIALACQWYMTNQQADGRYMYDYEPSRRASTGDDWCLRQLNAVYVLSDIAGGEAAPTGLRDSVERALQPYLRAVRSDGETAFVDWKQPRTDTGLGSTAFLLAALCEQSAPEHAELRRRLASALMGQIEQSGRFSTDFVKDDRAVDQNYYPGEAMLALALYAESDGDEAALDAMERAFAWYRDYWRRHRSAPYVPWQVRCYAALYRNRRDVKYRDYCFELQDWLLRVHPPLTTEEGAENAGGLHRALASTGVYSEGLAAAYLLARESADSKRTLAYGKALAGCLRYLLNLQYGPEDTYCFEDAAKIRGAFATKPRDHTLRLDFTYHAVSAMWLVCESIDDAEWAEIAGHP